MGNLPAIGLIGQTLIDRAKKLAAEIGQLPEDERIAVLNEIRLALHEVSPLKHEPVDCVLWIEADNVQANDYNPNVVAPPEMRLLELSIEADGFTQPIVTFPINGHREVVDGFHRNLVGKESKAVRERTQGYLPVTTIRAERREREDRIASTIRHNRRVVNTKWPT